MDLLFKQLPRALWQASAWRDLTVQADLRYDAPAACTLDALRPTDRDEVLPVVLHIHGGAFRVLSKETHGYVASRYARAGFLVLNVEYRLAPESPFPAAVRDVHAAWLWARDHVAELGGGPDRILLSGESAGANLALGLALSTTIDRDEPWARAVREAGARPLGVHACLSTRPRCGPSASARSTVHVSGVRPQRSSQSRHPRRAPAAASTCAQIKQWVG